MALTLEEQRLEFSHRRLLAMPIAGVIAWCAAGACGAFMAPLGAVWRCSLLPARSSWGLRFTVHGREFLRSVQTKERSRFPVLLGDLGGGLGLCNRHPILHKRLFRLPLSVGILSGLMWAPLSWIIEHWTVSFMPSAARD